MTAFEAIAAMAETQAQAIIQIVRSNERERAEVLGVMEKLVEKLMDGQSLVREHGVERGAAFGRRMAVEREAVAPPHDPFTEPKRQVAENIEDAM
jgi:hypothetical protein